MQEAQYFCDDGYWRFRKEDEADCDTSCPGNSDQVCGGYNRNSVYELDGSWKNGNGKLILVDSAVFSDTASSMRNIMCIPRTAFRVVN